MYDAYGAALLLGIIAGLRTATAPAVLWLVRHRSTAAYVLGALALVELFGDLHPKAPPRTAATGLIARIISGAFCGWAATAATAAAGAPVVVGTLLGVAGALGGAYGGLAVRTRAITAIGRVPAALLEDAIAIFGALFVVLGLDVP